MGTTERLKPIQAKWAITLQGDHCRGGRTLLFENALLGEGWVTAWNGDREEAAQNGGVYRYPVGNVLTVQEGAPCPAPVSPERTRLSQLEVVDAVDVVLEWEDKELADHLIASGVRFQDPNKAQAEVRKARKALEPTPPIPQADKLMEKMDKAAKSMERVVRDIRAELDGLAKRDA